MISTDRREFLALGAACALGLTTRVRREPTRIALLAPDVDGAPDPRGAPQVAAALDGARLGAEEVAHTFTLLRREVELVEGSVPPDAVAVVSLLPYPERLSLASEGHPAASLIVDARANAGDSAPCPSTGAFRIGDARPGALLWHESLFRYGAQQLNQRFRRRFGRGMDEHAWAGWFALKVVAESVLRARSSDPTALAAWLLRPRARFDGHKGVPLWFDASRTLVQPTYRVLADDIAQLEPREPCAL